MDKSGMVWIDVLRDFRARDGSAYYAEEKRLVSEEQRARFCAAGWASDPTGAVPTGAPNTGAARLEGVQDIVHRVSTTEGGN